MFKKSKTNIAIVLVILFSFAQITFTTCAADNISVKINGQTISFTDQTPFLENGRTMVPMRDIFEKLGASVDWDADTQTVTAAKDSTTISLRLGSEFAFKNGVEIKLDVPAYIVNGRSMVPLRFVSEALGAEVKWTDETSTVDINMPDTSSSTQTSNVTPTPAPSTAPTTAPSTTPTPSAAPTTAPGTSTGSIPEGYSYSGTWAAGSLKGANTNLKSLYTRDSSGHAAWNPGIKEACSVKISVYKVVHDSSANQIYTIYHNGTTDSATINFGVGNSEWEELGTYDFSGNGDEYVKLRINMNSATRVAEMKFEITSGANAGKVITIEPKL